MSLSLWLNIFSQGVVVFLLAQLSLILVWSLSRKPLSQFHHHWQYSLLWLFVLLPWIMGLSGLILINQNDLFTTDSKMLKNYVHWHHSFSFSWKSWHGVSIIITLLISLYLCLKSLRRVQDHYKINLKRRMLANLTSDKEGYFQHDHALAFTSGLIKPQIYISNSLAQTLSANELAMIKLHEQSHVDNLDPLQKAIFLFLASFYPKFVARQLIHSIFIVLEYRADQAIKKHYQTLDIADVLIKITRITKSSSSQLKKRLHYLLSIENITIEEVAKKKNPWINKYAYPLGILIIQILLPIIAVVVALDFLHHLLDDWLWHFNEVLITSRNDLI